MTTEQWKCSGCGIESPNQRRSCDCATNVVFKTGSRHAWKLDNAVVEAIAQAIRLLESQGYTVTSYTSAGAEPKTGKAAHDGCARGRTGGSIPPTGATGDVGSPGGRSMIPRETFDLLQIAEGYIRSAVWREETEPPFQRNAKTVNDLAKIQAALAALQNPRSKGSSTCNEPNIHALEIVLEDEISSSMRTDTPQPPADKTPIENKGAGQS